MERIPVETFPPGEFIQDELDARGWTTADVAGRMNNGQEFGINLLALDLLVHVHDRNMILDEATAIGLANAFDCSKEYFLSLDHVWRTGEYP